MAIINDKRKHPRLFHQAEVEVTYANGQSDQLQMHDFSDTGMFIMSVQKNLPEMGDLLRIKTLEIEDAPLLNAKVSRVVVGKGFAVEFI